MVGQGLDSRFWAAYAKRYDTVKRFAAYGEMVGEVVGAVSSHSARVVSNWFILDAGCGTGNVAIALAKAGLSNILGVDGCPEMLRRAKSKACTAGVGPKILFEQHDLSTPLLRSDGTGFRETFRAIVCINALYAMPNPEATAAWFKESLMPGGLLVIATPMLGASKSQILKHHLSARGGLRGAVEVMGMMPNLVRLGPMANRIEREYGPDQFFTEEEMHGFGEGLVNVRVAKTYAEQDWLLTGVKPPG